MKTIYVFLAVVALLATAVYTSAQLPDTWTQKATVGGIARQNAVGFSIGTKGYIGTGVDVNNNYFKDFWEYDPSTNAWTQKADFGGTKRHSAVGFSIGSKGYIGTGQEDVTYEYKNDFWEYDPSSNSWTQKANFGGVKRWQAVGFSIGTKGYLGTGWNEIVYTLSDFWEYDPASDTWTQKADFGGGIRSSSVGFNIGYKGYMGTGYANPTNYTKDFWEYDPSSNTWTRKADVGGANRCVAGCFSIGTKGYIGTGNIDPNLTNDFWEYDPDVNTWTQKANFGGGGWECASGFCIGTKGYMGTGVSSLTGTSGGFYEYTSTCPSPAAPVNTTPAGNLSICSGNSTTLTASGTGTLGWYDSPSGGSWLGGGTTFDTPILLSGITYYVQDSTNCGVSATRTGITVTVNPIPPAPVVTNTGATLQSSAPGGNQWYFEGTLISGATSQTYVATQDGYYWDVVTLNGCSSDTSNHKLIITGGIGSCLSGAITLYPVPGNGTFTVSINTASKTYFSIAVYNNLGAKIREEPQVIVNGSLIRTIDIRPVPDGLYTVIITGDRVNVSKKIVILNE
ncbi:MAG: T9SS type A sorting domain-containing protein [Bacteroidetes bacterium]|nr:T9SS type A sorting domain-containing protein [Bacteroidota bacterium]